MEAKDILGRTPLYMAVEFNNVEAVRILSLGYAKGKYFHQGKHYDCLSITECLEIERIVLTATLL